jgi:hypothetical protein
MKRWYGIDFLYIFSAENLFHAKFLDKFPRKTDFPRGKNYEKSIHLIQMPLNEIWEGFFERIISHGHGWNHGCGCGHIADHRH